MNESRVKTFPKLGLDLWVVLILIFSLVVAFFFSLMFGSVEIPLAQIWKILTGQIAEKQVWVDIVFKFRLPKAMTAMVVGAALAISGLQMQTLFRNPLADPYILGVSSGASLGVALVILGTGTASALTFVAGLSILGDLSLAVAASIGSSLVLGLVLILSRKIKNSLTLLIIGLMFGYLTNALVSLLIYFSQPERVQAFSLWNAGSFASVTWSQMRIFLPVIFIGIIIGNILIKPLNALLLGDDYARSLGVNVQHARFWIIFSASILTGVTTAFCGPIWFLGVAVPHLARSLLNSADHRVLMPSVMLIGATFALIADLIAQAPGTQFILPLNVVMSLFGVPIIIWVILRQKQLTQSFAS